MFDGVRDVSFLAVSVSVHNAHVKPLVHQSYMYSSKHSLTICTSCL